MTGRGRDATYVAISRGRLAVSLLLGAGIAAALGLAIRTRTVPAIDLATQVDDTLGSSGVSHEITAVLLNFRSYDTLLEIAVLLAAAIVALALRDPVPDAAPLAPRAEAPAHIEALAQTDAPAHTAARAIDTPVLASLVRALHPMLLLLAGYLLWAGSTRPGGAFQAGAVIAALGVIRRVSGVAPAADVLRRWQRTTLLAGFALFLALGAGMLLLDRPLLAWPIELAGVLILAIEAVLTVSIAVSLIGLFGSAPGEQVPAVSARSAPRR